MKFCWVDIYSNTDVDALFARYRDTMAALERDFPNVTFIHVTVPLVTERQGLFSKLKTRLKTVLGRSDVNHPLANVARERLNALIRSEYAGRHLFDLAAIQSTRPDGTRVSGRYDNQAYFALYDGYASDDVHLNAVGSKIAATAFLEAIARASRK
jgi:DNA-binding cell septation regulator SpoVG